MYQQAKTHLAENIKRLRISRGWSKVDLAQKAGLHRNTINDIEREEYNVSVRVLCQLAEQLNATPERLLMKPIRQRTRPVAKGKEPSTATGPN